LKEIDRAEQKKDEPAAARNSASSPKKKANRSLRTVGFFSSVPIAAEPASFLKEAG
jgi:hypothetical protein